MKNRNDDKKFIFGEYRKKEIKRLFNRIQEIQKKPSNNQVTLRRMFGETQNKLEKIPKNHSEQRLFDIRKENQRLVQKLASTKTTIFSHRLPSKSKKQHKFKLLDTLRKKEITDENKRLNKAIKTATSEFRRKKSLDVHFR